MDSQTVTPIVGQSAGPQVQAQPQAAQVTKRAVSEAAVEVKPSTPPEIDIRTRDPRSLQYQVDGSTKQIVATIVDDSNKVVLVQIPDAEVLRIAKAIDRMKGFLLEGKA